MNFIESLNKLKAKLNTPTEPEPIALPIEEIFQESDSIDIMQWIDDHEIDLKDQHIPSNDQKPTTKHSVFHEALHKSQFKTKKTIIKKVIKPDPSPTVRIESGNSITEQPIEDHHEWFKEHETWDSVDDPELWFHTKDPVVDPETSSITNEAHSFEDPTIQETDPSEILDHLNQFGIALKSADFTEKRKRGEEGVYRSKGAVEKTIDLHGMNLRDAELKIIRTFEEAKVRGYQQILIIHGRGKHSTGGEPKMKRMVIDMLEASLASKVSTFSFAPFSEGGGGATRVILK